MLFGELFLSKFIISVGYYKKCVQICTNVTTFYV